MCIGRETDMKTLENKRIVLAVCGSIAAVETIKLAHELRRRGAEVIPVITEAACGIIHPDESDPLIFNAIKLYCRSLYTDDTAKAAEWLRRYNELKSCLMMAEGYGYKEAADDE